MGIAEDVAELLGPVVQSLGVDLVDVEHHGQVLRVVVDQDGGVTTDTLAQINRLISPMLDDADPIAGRYTLEVSSPGVERRLRTLDHFDRAVGETAILKLVPSSPIRRLKGELTGVAGGTISLVATEIDGIELDELTEHSVQLDQVLRARTSFDWGPTPKKGGSKNGKAKKSKSAARNLTTRDNKQQSSKQQSSKQVSNKQVSGGQHSGPQDRGIE